MKHYRSGNIVKFRATFRSNGRPIDPEHVFFAAKLNDQAWTDPIMFTGSSTPSLGVLARITTGVFEGWYDTSDTSGTLVGHMWSTGLGTGSQIDTVVIDPVPA